VGPIKQDRTFFYFAYEGQRERVGLSSTARVPDPREIAALGAPPIPSSPDCWRAIPGQRLIDHFLIDNTGEPNLFVTTRALNDVDSLIGKLITHLIRTTSSQAGISMAPAISRSTRDSGGQYSSRLQHYHADYCQSCFDLLSKDHFSDKVNELRFGFNHFKEGFFRRTTTSIRARLV
jgi:hypothetical protein